MKAFFTLLVALLAVVGGVYALNYFVLGKPMHEIITGDSRNASIELSTHYDNYINPISLVINVQAIGDSSTPADVFRILLQYASQLKDTHFERVLLQAKGTDKFTLKGEYFQTLGNEYGTQNPVYTMRTFPEHVYKLDGSPAFETWSGGMLGVLGKQMEDFATFNQQWYINDLTTAN